MKMKTFPHRNEASNQKRYWVLFLSVLLTALLIIPVSAQDVGEEKPITAEGGHDTGEGTPVLVTSKRDEADTAEHQDNGNVMPVDHMPLAPEACTPGAAVRTISLANSLTSCDDCSAPVAALGFTVNFFGTNYSEIYVNSNGNLTFGSGLITYTPFGMAGTSTPIIAPYFADVDLRGGGVTNTVFYGTATVNGRPAFIATYQDVGYFFRNKDKLNTFQLILIDRSDVAPGDFDIEYNYDQIQWETGDLSGGSGGLGGNSAVVGYSAGDGVNFLEFPGSAVNGAFLDSNPTTGLINGSMLSSICGRYQYYVRNGTPGTSELGNSRKGASASELLTGNALTYTIVVQNDSTTNPALGATISDTLPIGVTYLPGSVTTVGGPAAVYNGGANRIEWGPSDIGPGSAVTVTFVTIVTAGPGNNIANTAMISATNESAALYRQANTLVPYPDLSGSSKLASSATITQGERLTYTIVLNNSSITPAAAATMTDTMPAGVVYAPGSLLTVGGPPAVYNSSANRVEWGPANLVENVPVTVTFAVTVTGGPGSNIVNGAVISDTNIASSLLLTAATTINVPNYALLDLAISLITGGAETYLDWNDAGYGSYEMWRSTAPYSGYAWYADIPVVSNFTDTVTTTSYFYEVYGVAGGNNFGPSNRVGVFNFAIVPGS